MDTKTNIMQSTKKTFTSNQTWKKTNKQIENQRKAKMETTFIRTSAK